VLGGKELSGKTGKKSKTFTTSPTANKIELEKGETRTGKETRPTVILIHLRRAKKNTVGTEKGGGKVSPVDRGDGSQEKTSVFREE